MATHHRRNSQGTARASTDNSIAWKGWSHPCLVRPTFRRQFSVRLLFKLAIILILCTTAINRVHIYTRVPRESSPKSSSPTKSSRQPAHTTISTSTTPEAQRHFIMACSWIRARQLGPGAKCLGTSEDRSARPSRSWIHFCRSSVE